jgi:hypothetical protein
MAAPIVPIKLTPIQSSYGAALYPIFTFEPSIGATHYKIYLWDNALGAGSDSGWFTATPISGICSYTWPVLKAQGSNAWCIKAKNADGESAYSSYINPFNIGDSPTPPVKISPIGNMNLYDPVYFKFNPSANGWAEEYSIYIWDYALGSGVIYDGGVITFIDNIGTIIIPLGIGTYAWFISGLNRSGGFSYNWGSHSVIAVAHPEFIPFTSTVKPIIKVGKKTLIYS